MNLRFPIRHYRMYPKSHRVEDYSSKSWGAEERTIELGVENCAIISVDTWNLCYGDEPLNPDKGFYWEYNYMGSREMVARIKHIVDNHITDLMTAARQAGVLIIHSEPGYIANREKYRPYQIYPDLAAPPQATQAWPPARFRQDLGAEISRWGFGEDCLVHWPDIQRRNDIAPPLQPVAGDIVMPQDDNTVTKLQRLFRERGIVNLLFVGFLTDMCLMHKPGGVDDMGRKLRYRAIVLRDCCQGHETEDTVDGFLFQKVFIKYFETGVCFTADSRDVIQAMRQDQSAGDGK